MPELHSPTLTRRTFIAGAAATAAGMAAPESERIDVLFENGTVVDGTGKKPFCADVAVTGDKITAVGTLSGQKAARRVDCKGLVVCPGFIDPHTHCDRTVVHKHTKANLPYVTQGVTTVVTGNCGLGPLDVRAYIEKLRNNGVGTNVAALLPYGPVRAAAMKNAPRPASADEMKTMRKQLDAALDAGAAGLSMGLHYDWNRHADTDEVAEIVKGLDGRGVYAVHMRDEGDQLVESVEEMIEVQRRTSVPVQISHFKASGKPNWGKLRIAAERIEAARAKGRPITADQYPYAASSTHLASYLLPFEEIPGDRKTLAKRMKEDAKFREHVRKVVERQLDRYEKILVPSRGKTIRQIAEAEGKPPGDVAAALHAHGVVAFAMCEEDVRGAMVRDWVVTGSDGPVSHPRTWGTFPRKIGRYCLREKLMPLEKAIHQSTGKTAEIFELKGRGTVCPGNFADLVVFDPKRIIDKADFTHISRPAEGIEHVLVNGRFVLEGAKPTKATAGRVLI